MRVRWFRRGFRPKRIATCTASSTTLTSTCVRPSTHKRFGKNWGCYGELREPEESPSARLIGTRHTGCAGRTRRRAEGEPAAELPALLTGDLRRPRAPLK